MLIEWIELDNFECYYTPEGGAPQKLEFAFNKNDQNLTFFVARNNSGKTTIIRALRFLFYNEVDEMQIVNNKALANIPVGGEITTQVRARVCFDYPSGPEWVTLERKYIAKRLEDSKSELRVRESQRQMTLTRRKTASRNKDYHGAEATAMVKDQLPRELFPFYFLDGENLKNRLGLGAQSFDKDMLNAIHGSLYYSVFERAEGICNKAIDKMQRELASLANQSRAMEQLQENRDSKALELKTYKNKHTEFADEYKKHEKYYRERDAKYLELAHSESNSSTEILKEARREESNLTDDIKRCSGKIRDSLSDALPYAFMSRASSIAIKVIDSLHERNIFPVNITEDLISELIKQKECVCGSKLEKGTKALQQLEEYRTRALQQNMDDDLKGIRSILLEDSRSSETIASKLSSSRKLVGEELKVYRAKMADLAECHDRMRKAKKKIKDGHTSIMQSVYKQRADAFSKMNEASTQMNRFEQGMLRVASDLKSLEDELKKKVPKGSRAEKVLQILSNLEQVQDIIKKSKKEIKYEIRSRLERHTVEIYEKISTDNSYAIVQSNLLPDIRNMGQKQNQGGGQKKVLTMAYMVGLANVRKEICAELRKHIHLKVTGEQCFFMDSIYSDMGPTYQQRVTRILPSFVKQLLILVAPQNCGEPVQSELKGHVTDLYRALNFTTKVFGDDPRSVKLWGKEVKLVEPLKDGLTYSQLEKLEII